MAKEPTNRHKIISIDNDGMADMSAKMYWQTGQANKDINDQQNTAKQAIYELYSEYKGTYKKLNRARAHFGRITEMELEEEADSYAMTKTFTFFSECADTDRAITDQYLNLVNDGPTTFLNAMKDVLGEEE